MTAFSSRIKKKENEIETLQKEIKNLDTLHSQNPSEACYIKLLNVRLKLNNLSNQKNTVHIDLSKTTKF